MNKKRFFLILLLAVVQIFYSQTIYDWKNAGLIEPLPAYTNTLNIQTLGADITGVTPCDGIYLTAINQCTVTNQSYTILFPAGVYSFTNTINLKDNVKLEGTGANTRLIFKTSNICIKANGSINSATSYSITQNANRYETFLKSSANSVTVQIAANNFIILKQRAAALVNDSWAYNSVGQFFKVNSISADTLKLNHEMRKDYSLTDTVLLYKTTPIKNSGIKCMRITRRNSVVNSNPTIQFLYAYNCFLDGIEVDSCFFSQVTIESSGNCLVSGSYFHDAYSYGNGGRGYGVVLQFNSGDHKIENNIFNHQRHSVLCQAGVNGNVIDYNYSINPYWTGVFLPSNSAGDMVLHGNYVYSNLFEGNICQNIVIDDSHGENGEHNTFFRNRAQLYGLYMNNNPASNNQNLIGNEITSTTPPQGLYTIAGTGHFEYGNKVQGVITPSGTAALTDVSYCYASQPAFLTGYSWPVIGIPNAYNTGTIPAEVRNASDSKTSCNVTTGVSSTTKEVAKFQIYPNPTNSIINISTDENFDEIEIINVLGEIVGKPKASSTINVSEISNGTYLFLIKFKNKIIYYQKVIVVN